MQKVFALKGHQRPLTQVCFNRESDLLFTSARDGKVCVWYTHNGERLGTYNGHNGAVSCVDVDQETRRLVTSAMDTTARIWDVESGRELCVLQHNSIVTNCKFSTKNQTRFLTVQDTSLNAGGKAAIFLYQMTDDGKGATRLRELWEEESGKKLRVALWTGDDARIITGGEDGFVRVWDVETGTQLSKIAAHKKSVQNLTLSHDKTMLVSASTDQSAKLFDVKSMQQLKTFVSNRPLNAAAISPVMTHVIVGGGQEARDVTTTSAKEGHFEVDFFHIVYEERLGCVRGHFGPVHTLAFSADGRMFASGSEDGFVRLHHFSKDYFDIKLM
jgi:translation initiation factor 3 subunit I